MTSIHLKFQYRRGRHVLVYDRQDCVFTIHLSIPFAYISIHPTICPLPTVCVWFYPSCKNKRSRPSLKVSPHISSPQLRLDCNPTQTNTAPCIHTVESVYVLQGTLQKNRGSLVFVHNCLCRQQCSSPNEKRVKNYSFIKNSKLRKVC